MNFIENGKESGDCTRPYIVEGYKSHNVWDFVEEVIKERPKEYGEIVVLTKSTYLDYPRIEYDYGKVVSGLDEKMKSMEIKSVNARGGWSLMYYYIKI